MTILKLIGFAGEIPRMIPRLLPDTSAQSSINARLESGDLAPYRQPKFVSHVSGIAAGNVQTIYRNGEEWLAWDKPVYAAPGPVADDRLYVMGDGAPKMIVDGMTYPLAVPLPANALTATVTGTGTGDTFARVYVYTYVTDFGEESEPCPASAAVNWRAGQTVTLSGFTAPPAGRLVTTQRIYRSQTSLSGTDLYYLTERPVSAADFVDNVSVNDQNEPIPSLSWNAPPDDLTGLISLPGGMMAAFRGKELWFCEPWRPHAWPEAYVITMEYEIMGLGAYGTTIVVGTKGQPYIVSGMSPDSMAEEKLELNLPCINPRGFVDLGYAVAYPSHDGLVVASNSGARVVTDQLMTRREWLLVAPERLAASQFYGRYFASYEYVDPTGRDVKGSFVIDLTGQDAFLHRVSHKADALWFDIERSTLFTCIGTEIYEWDSLNAQNDILTWRSKEFVVPKPTNFGVIRIEASLDITPEEEAAAQAAFEAALAHNASIYGDPSIGGEVDGAPANEFSVNGDLMEHVEQFTKKFVSVNVYADGKAVANVTEFNKVCRLPGGFKARVWEIEISTNAEISQVTLAGTGFELSGA